MRNVAAELEEPVGRAAAEPRAPGDVRQVTLAHEPGVEVDDAVERPRAVIGDDQDVLVRPQPVEHAAQALVEDPVHVGERARRSIPLPVVPAEVLNVVSRHEDDEEQGGPETLGEPEREVDLLVGRPTDDLEVDPAVLAEREPVVELERAEAARDLRDQLGRVRHPLLARGRVKAGDREALDGGAGQVKGMPTRPERRPFAARRSQTAGARRKLPFTNRSW